MDEQDFDVIGPPLELDEDMEATEPFVAGGRSRYPLAQPVHVPRGRYTIRVESTLVDGETVMLEVNTEEQTITVRRALPSELWHRGRRPLPSHRFRV